MPALVPTLPYATAVALEAHAHAVRRRAGVAPTAVVLAPTVAERLDVSIYVAPALRPSACLLRVGQGYRIYLREVTRESNVDVAHELGHWVQHVVANYAGAHEEDFATLVGLALLMPTPAAGDWTRFCVARPFFDLRVAYVGWLARPTARTWGTVARAVRSVWAHELPAREAAARGIS